MLNTEHEGEHDARAAAETKKKPRPGGGSCQAPGCNVVLSSTWYAANQSCAKAGCKRHFGVAGVYQPKGKQHDRKPLAAITNSEPMNAECAERPSKASKQMRVETKAAAQPPSLRERGFSMREEMMEAIGVARTRYGNGCAAHRGQRDSTCATCKLSRDAYDFCVAAELAPFQELAERVRVHISDRRAHSFKIDLKETKFEGSPRLRHWATAMSVSVIELDDDGEPTFELDPFSYGIAEEAKLKDSFAPSWLKADTQYEVRIEFYFNDDIDLNVYLGAEHGLTVRTRAVSTATPGLAGQIEQIATPCVVQMLVDDQQSDKQRVQHVRLRLRCAA